MKTLFPLLSLFLILVLGLTPVSAQFAAPFDITHPRGAYRDVETADIDGDGDIDVITCQSDYFNQATYDWYPNDGAGNFGDNIQIDASQSGAIDLEIGDIDLDGDLDILGVTPGDGTLIWFSNDGSGNFSAPNTITNSLVTPRNAHLADMDNDGDLDVISGNDESTFLAGGPIFIFFNNGSGVFPTSVLVNSGVVDLFDYNAADLDNDGDLDVISSSYNTDDLCWYENLGGAAAFGPKNVISTSLIGSGEIEVDDIDGDGDIDIAVVGNGDDRVAWFRNNSSASSFTMFGISDFWYGSDDCEDLVIEDIDGDGDKDIIATMLDENEIQLFENLGGGTFAPNVVINSDIQAGWALAAADLDGDGDIDIVSGSQNDARLAWLENTAGSFSPLKQINKGVSSPTDIEYSDLDGDGDLDIISTSSLDDKLAWYENTGGLNFNQNKIISLDLDLAKDAVAYDFDADGDQDIAVIDETRLVLFLNDGAANFTSSVLSTYTGTKSINIGDIDVDGLMDIVVTDWWASELSWIKNNGGGAFGTKQIIASVGGAHGLDVNDMDGDGDPDFLVGVEFNDEYYYYENTGAGVVGAPVIIADPTNGTFDITSADIDNDGDRDALWISAYGNQVGYTPNLGGGVFGPQVVITTVIFPYSIETYDPDGDGDLDILVSGYNENRTLTIINQGGGVFSGKPDIAAIFEWPREAIAADLDGDGDEDVASAFRNSIVLSENLRLTGGVCNASIAPINLNVSFSGGGNANLSWDPVAGSVGCQVKGRPIGATSFATISPILGTEPIMVTVPSAQLISGLTYEWQVRCACSISPLITTPFSSLNMFTVPSPRLDGELNFWPNPASDHIQVNALNAGEYLLIYDLQGRILIQGNIGQTYLDISSLSTGTYQLMMADKVNSIYNLGNIIKSE